MFESTSVDCLVAACAGLALFFGLWLRSERRVKALERNLLQCSDVVCQMMELQMQEHQKLAGSINDIEERLLSMTACDTEAPRPMDRRHQVLTLSRKGAGPDEIAKRLNIPRGEAELILDLKKYVGGSAAKSAGA